MTVLLYGSETLRHHKPEHVDFLVTFSLEARGLGGLVMLPDAADCLKCCSKDT